MNKNIMIPLVALMILAMVGAASAAEVTELEIRGTVQGATVTGHSWDATSFAAFWYDLDKGLSTETLAINGTLTGASGGRTIAKEDLTYTTHPVSQGYEICDKYGGLSDAAGGNVTIGDDDATTYSIIGWMAEEYVAVNDKADKLTKLLVEFEGDDKKTLSTGETWDLGGGFGLTAQQIDLEGDKVWLSLAKDGKELDSEVIDASASASNQKRTYEYTEDVGSEDDVPIFHCYIDAVFRGTDSNIVQVTYVFLIDNTMQEVEEEEKYGIMEVTTANANWVNLTNDASSLSLDSDSKEHIMGDMYFLTAKNDTVLRFYPMTEYTIGGVVPDDADEIATEVETEPADVNVTDGDGAEPADAEPADAEPAEAATAEPTEEPEEPVEEPTEKPKVPGFEAVFAISGLLAIAYLVLRQRD